MKPNDKAIEAAILEADANIANRNQHEWFCKVLTAAYDAQFQSGDYAGLVKQLRDWGAMNYKLCDEAADALETVLADRDALKAENKSMTQSLPLWAHKQMAANNKLIERLRAERDALAARLAPVDDKALVGQGLTDLLIENTRLRSRLESFEAIKHMHDIEKLLTTLRNNYMRRSRETLEIKKERERCANVAETVANKINVAPHERPEWEDGYLQGVYDVASAIRSGK